MKWKRIIFIALCIGAINAYSQPFSTVIESKGFRYRFQDDEFEYYREVRALLEKSWKRVYKRLGYNSAEKIEVEFFMDLASAIGAPMKIKGFGGNGKIQLNIPGGDDDFAYMVRVSLHELVHVVYNKLPILPAEKWFKEGLAEYISDGPRSELQIAKYIDMARGKDTLDLRYLNISLGSSVHEDKEIAYAVSKQFVGYLVEKFGMAKIRKLMQADMNFPGVCGKSAAALFDEFKEQASL